MVKITKPTKPPALVTNLRTYGRKMGMIIIPNTLNKDLQTWVYDTPVFILTPIYYGHSNWS